MLQRLFIVFFILLPLQAYAQQQHNPQPFALWLQDLRAEALQQGIGPAVLDEALNGLLPLPRVIELDRKQPESTLTFQEYIKKVLPQARIDKARRLLNENRTVLESISAKYHVQPEYIVALWGIESDFGDVMGNFEIIPALATLAYDGRRSHYFRDELLKALRIAHEGHIGVHEMKGSWAGAMGQSQFMPSSFLNFAVDANGDGRKDIWGTQVDVFGSIANYLRSEGWNDEIRWGEKVRLPKGFDVSVADIAKPRTLEAWQGQGISFANHDELPPGTPVSLISVNKDAGTAPYYVVTNNYRVILKWNRSRYFATAVGMLADSIKGE